MIFCFIVGPILILAGLLLSNVTDGCIGCLILAVGLCAESLINQIKRSHNVFLAELRRVEQQPDASLNPRFEPPVYDDGQLAAHESTVE